MTEKEISDAAALIVVLVTFVGVISWFIMFLIIAVHLIKGGCLL